MRAVSERHATRGFSMIEVLVSLVIFSFGLLGMMALHVRALGYSQVSLYRTQATAFAQDLFDRTRVDRAGALAGGWNTAYADAAASYAGGASLVSLELAEWKGEIESVLPSGQARVSVDAATQVVLVEIQWNERGVTLALKTQTAL